MPKVGLLVTCSIERTGWRRRSPPAASDADLLRQIVARVAVSESDARITIDRNSLGKLLDVPVEPHAAVATVATIVTIDRQPSANGAADSLALDPIVLIRPIALKRQGKEQRLILTSAAAETRAEPTMIKAVVQARRWFEMLKQREVDSIADLGRREKLARAFISHRLPLAFLAPDITQAVIEGMQPIGLTLDSLIEIAVASEWTIQRQAFRAA